ncbi:lipoate--protein ligase [Bacteroidota bacterium]
MKCIADHRTDPYFNLAAEEYLLKNSSEEYFMLWRNEPSIVLGKHQNALAEIDLTYAREKGFKVARRISGGGTVFHDLGNLNFSFISNGEEGKLINYRRFATPIVEVLGKLDVVASFSKRDDILIDGMKISGNASHVYKKRVLHHGTLLFSSDLTDLSKALKTAPGKFSDKAVKSVRSRVTNISDHLNIEMDVKKFRDVIMEYILDSWQGSIRNAYSEGDIQEIEQLAEERFSTWEWNFAYSPKYVFRKEERIKKGLLSVEMKVVSGIIEELYIQSDFLGRSDTTLLEKMLTGIRHDPLFIEEEIIINEQKLSDIGITQSELTSLFL